VLAGLVSAIADTLYETAGVLLCRTVAAANAGDTSITVDGLYRWPLSGEFVVNGERHAYTGAVVSPALNRLTGISQIETGASGLASNIRATSIVAYSKADQTDLDAARSAYFVNTAVGGDLDTLARNYGLLRPRGMADSMFRDVLKVLIYLDATTIYSVEKVLDAIVGAGNYEVWDTPLDPTDHHKVFVRLQPSPTNVYRGKAFLVGGELQPSAGATVATTFTPSVVYGVYAKTTGDYAHDRQVNDNLLYKSYPVFTTLGQPVSVQSASGAFLPTDVGETLVFDDGQIWPVTHYVSGNQVKVGRASNAGAITNAAPAVLTSRAGVFRKWMIGVRVTVTDAANPLNEQTGLISEVISPYSVRLSSMSGGGWVGADSLVTFDVTPVFGTASFTARLPRFTLSGNVITAPNTLPASVYVDYATIPSAQVMREFTDSGVEQFPLYLFDDTFFAATILDLILAAGCHAEVVRS
jgi:hypothetical protein